MGKAAPESWLSLDDDELLHRIASLAADVDADPQLLEVIQSDRHFYVRQEAAKRIRDRQALFAFENDRHVGQIVVRHLNRSEDLEYLARLAASGRYSEVRTAAQVQLRRLRERLNVPEESSVLQDVGDAWRVAVLFHQKELLRITEQSLPRPEFELTDLPPHHEAVGALDRCDPHLVITDMPHLLQGKSLVESVRQRPRYIPLVVLCPSDLPDPVPGFLLRGADELVPLPVEPELLAAKVRALLHFAHRRMIRDELAGAPSVPPPAPGPSASAPPPAEATRPDGTLLGWAIHFIVEPTWIHLGTHVTWVLLKRTRADLLDRHPLLRRFEVDNNARVSVDLSQGPQFPPAAVAAVAAWMAAYLTAAARITVHATSVDVRHATALMAQALEHVGFYQAYDAEVGPRPTLAPAS